ncbi:MAG: dethiobiotin synthase [Chitinispirillales bacterium]|jgi:dethiobiotin synthase|nr:dethiobiotin synthase [Chitinispirillales bacterium]
MRKKFVIIAPDTDCAKTITTSGLLTSAINKKIRSIASKPIQTGCSDRRSKDLDFAFSTAKLNVLTEIYEKLVLCKLKTPSSPLLASQLENISIDWDEIVKKIIEVSNDYDLFFIETAGGIYTPITCGNLGLQKSFIYKYGTNADFAKALKCPVLLSIPNRVGAISLGVMTVNCAKEHGLQIAGAIFSQTVEPKTETDIAILRDNVETFQYMTGVKVLANVPFIKNIENKSLAIYFDYAIDFLINM